MIRSGVGFSMAIFAHLALKNCMKNAFASIAFRYLSSWITPFTRIRTALAFVM
jgi:hypothetical protein